jgi:uncharacterized membrane protein YeaQ/YmgE (transglycosylase-associated protein family)
MSSLMFVLSGIAAGLLARAIAAQPGALGGLPTALLGLAGLAVGAFVASMLASGDQSPVLAAFIGAIVGTVILIAMMRFIGLGGSKPSPGAPRGPGGGALDAG